MPRDDLPLRERAVLFALLGAARPVSNPELGQLIGFPLVGAARRRLNDRKYVESRMNGRVFVHELSDGGWRWCADELAAGPAGRGSSLERAHSLVFGAFARYLAASRLSLADVIGPASAVPASAVPASAGDDGHAANATGVAGRVEAGYRALAPAAGEFVRLRELRLRLADIGRPDVDAALTELFARQRINLIPESHQQSLSAADRESALRLGGEDKHLISIE